ncbi:DUF3291 domain-containing protein [Arcticibacter sp. MXS-1]|uniref:DUF3291 domain-containing protein n=1 Tax=Arcticibacter sp. MXS-1 TaxID=3341726 RepID=UPI0035A8A270
MVVSFTVVRYPKRYIPLAFLAMAIHRLPLALNRSCSFWKLMGSGNKGSFDLTPDLRQWALLASWESEEAFYRFHSSSFIGRWWKTLALESWTILCSPIAGHGQWDGRAPFEYDSSLAGYKGPLAVLTRATIRPARLRNFWSNVGSVSSIMSAASGYIQSFGVGEAPVYKQATFSLWKSSEEMKNFAYASQEHREVIRKTREEGWYSEELFARFKPIATLGSIGGRNFSTELFDLTSIS